MCGLVASSALELLSFASVFVELSNSEEIVQTPEDGLIALIDFQKSLGHLGLRCACVCVCVCTYACSTSIRYIDAAQQFYQLVWSSTTLLMVPAWRGCSV